MLTRLYSALLASLSLAPGNKYSNKCTEEGREGKGERGKERRKKDFVNKPVRHMITFNSSVNPTLTYDRHAVIVCQTNK